jgi:hypothetical protein
LHALVYTGGMNDGLVCWKCGASLEEMLLPLSRQDKCRACNADLHVCRLCRFYNSRVSDHCNEPLAAGQVGDVSRANFCDYFTPRPDAWQAADTQSAASAKNALDALFDNPTPGEADTSTADSHRAELDALFGKDEPDTS